MNQTLSPEMFRAAETDLLNAMAAARAFADLALKDHPQSLMPQLLVYAIPYTKTKAELTICSIAGDFNGPEKGTMLFKMGMHTYARRQVPTHVVLVTESWLSKDMYEGDRRKFLLPEDDPARVECVNVQLLCLDGRARINGREVKRDARERMEWGGNWELMEDVQVRLPLLYRFFKGFADAAGYQPQREGA